MPEAVVFVSIQGRVQRVGFRAWTEQKARELDLSGWVRNEPDGSVAALIGGSADAVARMLELLRTGPRHAEVIDVTTSPADAGQLPEGFRQLR